MPTLPVYIKTIAKSFAITRGAKGSLMFDGESSIEIAPFPVKAIDTVGAGDMYAGAVLYGLTNGMDWANAELGSLASSRVVTIPGARLMTADVRSILAQVTV